jgi:hypothetical protein
MIGERDMKTLLTTAALAALLAASPAFAQSADQAPADQQTPAATDSQGDSGGAKLLPKGNKPAEAAQTPATDANKPAEAAQAPAMDANKPAEAAQAPATDQNKPAEAAKAPAAGAPAVAATDQQFLTQQGPDERLASSWIGATIYNSADESVGGVNDLLIGKGGSVDAVIVGVGGFLGIGEKNIAVPLSAVEATTDANGGVKLVIKASKEQIDAAPEFLTLADLKARQPAPAAPDATQPAAPAPAQ